MNKSSPINSLVTIIIPVYKNEDTLRELCQRLHKTLDINSISHTILLVIDACPGNSLFIARQLCLNDTRIRTISLKNNLGQQKAALFGLNFSKGKIIVFMDADLQDPPEAIPKMMEKLGEGYHAVFAGRRGRYESSFRLFTSRIFKRIIHLLSSLPADAGFFMIITRQMADQLLNLKIKNPHVPSMIGFTDLSKISFPVSRNIRPTGKSAYNFLMRFNTGLTAIFTALTWKLYPDKKFRNENKVGYEEERDSHESGLKANYFNQIAEYIGFDNNQPKKGEYYDSENVLRN
jgi:glycosyltransferase involved in cell wall biosynthesis